jgi:adenosylmethionine---8-amino-7-oxononanoate aminotransferase
MMVSLVDFAFDAAHIWHPYTSLSKPLPVYGVESAQGCEITLCDGRVLIDGMASWWACIHGYNHPRLNLAITQQLSKISHVMFGGLTHHPAIELSKLLLKITPDCLDNVFLSDSGSIAVEVALKMALQYWMGRGAVERDRFVTVRGGYHGDTYHAMSVCDPVGGMHSLFSASLPKYVFADQPQIAFGETWDDRDLESLRLIFQDIGSQVAAVILEPIVQGAGGMRFYHPKFLRGVRELCNEFDCLLILDEIATGFGRSGQLFAHDWATESGGALPDILCLGKGLTGGYLTLGATLATAEIASGVGLLMHGPTFMGNPLACAVAVASVSLLLESDWKSNISRIESRLRSGLQSLAELDQVKEVRVLGAIGVVEMMEPVDVAAAQKFWVDRGVWVRPFRNLIYVMPPYVISDGQLDRLTGAIEAWVTR